MSRRTLRWVVAIASLGACAREESGPEARIPASLEVGEAPAALATVAAERVVGYTGPGGAPFEVALRTAGEGSHLQRRIGVRTFPLPLRTTGLTLTQYPCGSCHEGRGVLRRQPDVHQNIGRAHPPESGATCVTCHRAGAVETLTLAGGRTATFDHAYRLCAQCHSPQVEAWAAGHHGKRLDGWRARRVVMGCADCHDPHRPETTPRTPFPGPELPEEGTLLPGEAAHPEETRFPLPPNAGRGR